MTDQHRDDPARRGWDSDFPHFRDAEPRVIRARLEEFLPGSSPEQIKAWDESIPKLQTEVREVLGQERDAGVYTAILEYELPMESRRPDVILLVRGAVVVLELKGKTKPTRADIDQAAAYARDLRCYHRECANYDVHAVLVPTRAQGHVGVRSGVHVVGPDALDGLVQKLQPPWPGTVVDAGKFLAADAYCPLPTLVQAARELMRDGELRRIRKASAATDPAVEEITRIVHEAARTKTRRLVLVTGVPGAGKTLVGLRAVHAHYLDDLAPDRPGGKPTAPGIFLSGNGPLVQVLQYELKDAGGGGKTFVRDVHGFIKRHALKKDLIPQQQVLVFDEAQRAWDVEKVTREHGFASPDSEPGYFIEFASRIPEWCVVIGLIGGGQEIHDGEESGLIQWREAVERAPTPGEWVVHGGPGALELFQNMSVPVESTPALNLDTEIRFHLVEDVQLYVAKLLEEEDEAGCKALAERLETAGFHLRLTRDLDAARAYLRDRYRENRDARFGLVASARDRDLTPFGVRNGFHDTKQVRWGPWYGDAEESPRSCRRLNDVVTEFGAQGLELDAVLLAWGTDFIRDGHGWSNARARRYKAKIKDAYRLRQNAYRVLLTRARDVNVVFLPPLEELDETCAYLLACGFTELD